MKKFILLTCLFGVIFTVSEFGFAEEGKNTEVIKLEQVVVTATRTERKIKDVPATVTVITREEIEKSNAEGAFDLLRTVSGVCVQDSAGIGMQGRVSLRGFDPFGSKYVLVLVDGVPVNEGDGGDVSWHGSVPPLENIERIEVVKGPTSALYGGSAMGGTIHIITKSGKLDPYTKIASSFGSDSAIKGEVSTGGTTKNLSYRFGATYLKGDGWRDRSDHEKKNFFAKISVAPDEESDFTVNFSYADIFYELARGLTEAQYKADPKQSVYPYDSSDTQAVRGNVTYQRDINKYNQFKALLWAFQKRYDMYMDFWGVTEYISDISTLGAEVQHNLKYDLFGKPNSFLLGLSVKGDETDYQTFKAPERIRGDIKKDNYTRGITYALFIQDEFTAFAPLTITLGARYDRIEYDHTDYLDDTESGNKSFDRITPKFGIVYRFNDTLSMFGNIGQAFKSPACGKLFAGAYANSELDPELVTNYEIGLNAQLSNKLSFKLSGYWMDVEDEIITTYHAIEKKYEYQNAGETRRKGVESELDLEILKGLTAFVNLNYQEAEFTDYTDKYGTYDGNKVPYAPDCKISSGIRYHHLVGLTFNLGMNWIDDQYSDRKNTHEIPSHTVWNTRLDFERDWWSAYLTVNNLFDEDYYEYRVSGGDIYPSPGRTFMGGISIEF